MTNVDQSGSGTRVEWADFCRFLAIVGVVLIHACGLMLYQYGKIPTGDWLWVNLMDSFVRCSVPLFVMLSGALLLNEVGESDTVRSILVRVGKVGIPLLVWNVLFLLYVSYHTGQPISLGRMFTEFPMYHLWFVYMIIGLYLVLPVLRGVFHHISASPNVALYLFSVWFALTCLPLYTEVELFKLMQQTSLLGYGGYFILGAWLRHLGIRGSTLFWLSVYMASVAGTFLLTWWASRRAGALVETAYLYFSVTVVMQAIAAFSLMTRLALPTKVAVVMRWLSDRSFLVFFMHVVVLERVQQNVMSSFPLLPVPVHLVLVTLLTTAISLAIASVIRWIPQSRRILG